MQCVEGRGAEGLDGRRRRLRLNGRHPKGLVGRHVERGLLHELPGQRLLKRHRQGVVLMDGVEEGEHVGMQRLVDGVANWMVRMGLRGLLEVVVVVVIVLRLEVGVGIVPRARWRGMDGAVHAGPFAWLPNGVGISGLLSLGFCGFRNVVNRRRFRLLECLWA